MVTTFGITDTGQTVERIRIGTGALTADVLTYGAILQSVRLAGVDHDLTLGSDDLADYQGAMHYHGALVAPLANRLMGPAAEIDGKICHFPANEGDSVMLHSGDTGSQAKVWTLADYGPDHVTLTVTLPDGEGGFPGERRVDATFRATGAMLQLDITATSERTTLFNAVNHSYWNLDGTEDWTGHRMRVAADHYLPTRPDLIPTGEIAPVDRTPFDFRAERTLVPAEPPLDSCFCIGRTREALRDVLWLTGSSGVTMTLATTEPGIQIYDGRNPRPGHRPYEGLAIEPQFWPDAPNHPAFPSVTLTPGDTYHQTTTWRFATA